MHAAPLPDGVSGEKVHQKRLPHGAPPWVETVRLHFPRYGLHADELCVTRLADVAWAVQMTTVEFHPWNSRRADTEKPDEWRIDLDPMPDAPFARVRRAAHVAHEVLDELGAVGWPKTCGGHGLHVYVRIQPDHGFGDVRRAALAFAREVERRLPDDVTTTWWRKDRDPEAVFVDYNQNARDHTIAAAYSVRGNDIGTVSTPFRWDELDDVEPDDFTIATVPERYAELGDLHAGIDEAVFDIAPLLEWADRDEAAGRRRRPSPRTTRGSPDGPRRPAGPRVPQGLTVPAAELVERFSRSSGPGGQGVNTADSRVELELDVVAATGSRRPSGVACWRRSARGSSTAGSSSSRHPSTGNSSATGSPPVGGWPRRCVTPWHRHRRPAGPPDRRAGRTSAGWRPRSDAARPSRDAAARPRRLTSKRRPTGLTPDGRCGRRAAGVCWGAAPHQGRAAARPATTS